MAAAKAPMLTSGRIKTVISEMRSLSSIVMKSHPSILRPETVADQKKTWLPESTDSCLISNSSSTPRSTSNSSTAAALPRNGDKMMGECKTTSGARDASHAFRSRVSQTAR